MAIGANAGASVEWFSEESHDIASDRMAIVRMKQINVLFRIAMFSYLPKTNFFKIYCLIIHKVSDIALILIELAFSGLELY